MTANEVKINGVIYTNVGSITPEFVEEYYHDVTSLSGIIYRARRYTKTNYTVQFYNILDGTYNQLKTFIQKNKGKAVECAFIDDNGIYREENFYIKIQSEIIKGRLRNVYYRNGLTLHFEAVVGRE